MSNPSPTIPLNEEHLEAVQATVNDERATIKAAMSPEARARLEVIEDCSRRLEAAKVPFVLYAQSQMADDSEGYIRFNRLDYSDKGYIENTIRELRKLACYMTPFCSMTFDGPLVIHGADGPAISVCYLGKAYTPAEWEELLVQHRDKDEENQS